MSPSSGGWKLEIRGQHSFVGAVFLLTNCQFLIASSYGGMRVGELWDPFYKDINLVHDLITKTSCGDYIVNSAGSRVTKRQIPADACENVFKWG